MSDIDQHGMWQVPDKNKTYSKYMAILDELGIIAQKPRVK
jgi:hypothetical protein